MCEYCSQGEPLLESSQRFSKCFHPESWEAQNNTHARTHTGLFSLQCEFTDLHTDGWKESRACFRGEGLYSPFPADVPGSALHTRTLPVEGVDGGLARSQQLPRSPALLLPLNGNDATGSSMLARGSFSDPSSFLSSMTSFSPLKEKKNQQRNFCATLAPLALFGNNGSS